MIRISKIDSGLSIYKNNSVIIWGVNGLGASMLKKLTYAGIRIVAFCDNNEKYWGGNYENIPIISPEKLNELTLDYSNIIVQIAGETILEKNILSQLSNMNILDFILFKEGIHALNTLEYSGLFPTDKTLKSEFLKSYIEPSILNRKSSILPYLLDHNGTCLFLCLPTKTGDHTLNETLSNFNVSFYNIFHSVGSISKSVFQLNKQKIKFITAVRDPIAQNLSIVYEYIDKLPTYLLTLTDDDMPNVLTNGGDAQIVFDTLIFDTMKYMETMEPIGEIDTDFMTAQEIFDYTLTRIHNIQRFIPEFQANIGDIMQKPFDKQKGCTVIETENLEIFVYQLEKLNDILPELSDFVGRKLDNMTIGHTGESKWCANSYKNAQNNIRFSQEYFDKCYDEPYVKHFYSEEDIEKFKKKWENNIK